MRRASSLALASAAALLASAALAQTPPTPPAQLGIVPDSSGAPVSGVEGGLQPQPAPAPAQTVPSDLPDQPGQPPGPDLPDEPGGQTAVPGGIETPRAQAEPARGAPATPGAATPSEIVSNASPEEAETTDFGSWRMECYAPAVAGVACQILQRVINAQANQPVMVVAMAHVPGADRTELEMALPLGFEIGAGVGLSIGDYETRIPVARCTNLGCIAEGVAAAELLAAMRGGATAEIALPLAGAETFDIPLYLDGFGEAHAAMVERNSPTN